MSNFIPKGPWKKEESQHEPQDNDQSLTTVLKTHEDRTALLLLVVSSLESMRKNFELIFDPNETGKASQLPIDSVDTSRPSSSSTPKDKGEHGTKSELPAAKEDEKKRHEAAVKEAEGEEARVRKEAEAKEKARQEHERRVKELNSPKMQELKKAALAYFQEWQDRVIERVGEAVNQTDEANKQKEKTRSGPASEGAKGKINDSKRNELADTALKELHPPENTPLVKLDEAARVLILHSLLLLVLGLEHYAAQSRVLLLKIASSLDLPINILTEDECKVAQGLLEAAKQQMNADEETKKKAHDSSVSRKWKVGLGAAAGATLIGVTGGLAAPFLAAGVGTIFGGLGLGATATATYLGAMAGSAPLVGILFGAYGGRMASELVDNYAKEVSDFAFIPVRKPTAFASVEASRRLRVAIGISGWLTETSDVVKPWHVIGKDGIEAFALRWELEVLLNLGHSMTTYLKSAAWGWAQSEIIKHTVFSALSAAMWPLAIVKAARLIDNPFSVARSRSEKAGRVLADALINKVQGERPVTLVGYSLGARVIYSCLEELARREAFGLVESAVFAGAAVPADSVIWRKIRCVVAGRVVNVYSRNDYLLGFLYRSSSLQYGIAGLQPIDGVRGVENVDVTETVTSHTRYRYLTGKVLKKIGFEDIDDAAVEQEEKRLRHEETKEKAEQEKKEAEAKAEGKDSEEQLKEMEKEVENKNKATTREWMTEKMAAMRVAGFGKDGKKAEKPERDMTEEEKFMSAQQGEYTNDAATAEEKEKFDRNANDYTTQAATDFTTQAGSKIGGWMDGGSKKGDAPPNKGDSMSKFGSTLSGWIPGGPNKGDSSSGKGSSKTSVGSMMSGWIPGASSNGDPSAKKEDSTTNKGDSSTTPNKTNPPTGEDPLAAKKEESVAPSKGDAAKSKEDTPAKDTHPSTTEEDPATSGLPHFQPD